MGVDWYACGICGETFPDCGEYGTCANCEEDLCQGCHDEQNDKYGTVEEGSDDACMFGDEALKECDLCSSSIVRDSDVIDHLLKVSGMSKEEVIEAIKAKRPAKHGVNCKKVEHVGTGYLHSEKDDSPYDVDGCMYCGRCHTAI